MVWIDFILIGLLLFALIAGAKRGLFSGINGLIGLIAGVIVAVTYSDWVTHKVLSHMRVSPVAVTLLSFLFFFVVVYFFFKILGYLFYKFAELKRLGRIGSVGGAIFGVFQGWIVLGFLLILLMFLPMPQGFVKALDSSVLAPMMRGTIPFIYEESAPLHPESPHFIEKIEKALDVDPVGRIKQGSGDVVLHEMDRAEEIIRDMEDYFGSR
jgi:membrane protein required for colicin V production